MAQVINETPQLGFRLGTGLGQGLGAGLNELANYHVGNLLQQKQQAMAQQQQQRTSGLLQQFGLAPEAANFIAILPPKEQWAAVQELSGLGALGGLQQQEQGQQQQSLGQLAQPQETSQPLSQVLGQMGQQMPRSVQELFALRGLQQQPQAAAQMQQPSAQQPQQIAPPPEIQQKAAQAPAQGKGAQGAQPRITQREVKRPVTPADQLALKRQLVAQKEMEKEQRIAQKDINKETEDFYKTTIKDEQAAKKSDLRLGRLEQLVKKGNLPGSTWYRLFKDLSEEGLGINTTLAGAALGALAGGGAGTLFGGPAGAVAGITAGQAGGAALGGLLGSAINPLAKGLGSAALAIQRKTSPDVEEFEKLSTDFIREAKEIFGARVTNQDLTAFMQIIPTLMQTDAGKNRVIENMRFFNKANHVRYNAMKQIIDTNGGKRPANIELLVDEYTQPQLDKLADQFKEGIVTTTSLPQLNAKPLTKAAVTGKQPGVIGSARRRANL